MSDDTPSQVQITVRAQEGPELTILGPVDDHRVTLLGASGALRVAVPGRTVMFAPGKWVSVNTEAVQ